MDKISALSYRVTCMCISLILKVCKLRINTENFEDTLDKGEIFVFNHFTRFETALPQYLLYCLNNDKTYAIAYAPLFKIPVLGWFIRKLGAVPHNLQDLLPLLTDKISEGYKVVIFPQGKMVKNHEDVDMKTGGAILALATDLYKRHITDNQSDYSDGRVEWASTKTYIVAGNISYYPLRTEPNALSRLAKRFNLSGSIVEELTIEGNMFSKTTDVNFVFEDPIRIDSRRIDVSRAKSLKDCYQIVRSCRQERDDVRKCYNKGIYQNLKINHGHVFSEIIYELKSLGIRSVSKAQLLNAMESACEGVGIEFVKAEYKDLVRMSTDRKLLVEKRHNYRFSLRMDKVHPFDFVRMTNPLKVYRNELRPLAEVRKRISEGLRHSRTNSKQGFVLVPKEPCGEAVLLIHGLFATANQCRFVAEELRDYGYEVHVPLIAGHGTDVEQLSTIGRAEWYDSIRGAIPHKPFHVVGFSTGGLIAAHIARDYKVLSLSTICAPTSFVQKNIAFTKVLSVLQFPRYVDNHGDSETYNQMPVHTLSELLYFTEETKKVFPEVKVNTLVVQADYDPIVTPSSGQEIHSLIKGSKLIIVESQEHNINNSKDIVIDFIRSNNE